MRLLPSRPQRGPLQRTARRLSTHRRSRFAGVAVMLAGLLVSGGAYALLSPAGASSEVTDDAATVAEGRELFLVGCSSCHGKNAEGVVTQSGTQYGPSLVGVGAASVDFQVGTGRMPMAAPGAQAPRKDRLYDEQETAALAAYVASLGPGPAIPDEESYDVDDVSNEDLVRGGEFFRTNCTACHNFQGAGGALPGGKYAPALTDVDAKYIYEAMVTGPQQMPVFADDVLTPEEKRQIIAYIKTIDEEPGYGGFGMGSLGPVSDGMFGWLIGIGSLVGFAVWIAAHSTRSKKKVDA